MVGKSGECHNEFNTILLRSLQRKLPTENEESRQLRIIVTIPVSFSFVPYTALFETYVLYPQIIAMCRRYETCMLVQPTDETDRPTPQRSCSWSANLVAKIT